MHVLSFDDMWPPQAPNYEGRNGINTPSVEIQQVMEDDCDPGFGAVANTQFGKAFRPIWRSWKEGSFIIKPSLRLSGNPQKEFLEEFVQDEQRF